MSTPHTGTIGEIAENLGVSRQRVHQWKLAYPDFPPPLTDGRTGGHYDLDAVSAWATKKGLGNRAAVKP